MKLIKICEILALIIGLSAIITILFYLILKWGRAVWLLEPIVWIRIPEIIMGVFSVVILLKIIKNKVDKWK